MPSEADTRARNPGQGMAGNQAEELKWGDEMKLKIELGESLREHLLDYAKQVLRMKGIPGNVKDIELIAIVKR